MNVFFIIAGLLLLVAFLVHLVAGDREYRQVHPAAPQLFRFWLLGRCTFHVASADLLLSAAVLLATGLGVLPYSLPLLGFIAVLYGSYCLAWLLTVKYSGAQGRDYLALGQWMLFLLVFLLTLGGL